MSISRWINVLGFVALSLASGMSTPLVAEDDSRPLIESEKVIENKTDDAESPSDRSTASQDDPTPASLNVTVTVNAPRTTDLNGELVELQNVAMKTSFGDVAIPLAEVAGIHMASQEVPHATVVLHNGDTITGTIELEQLTVNTAWGIATINTSSVASILFAPDLSWNASTGLNGKRWALHSTKSMPVQLAPALMNTLPPPSYSREDQTIIAQPVISY